MKYIRSLLSPIPHIIICAESMDIIEANIAANNLYDISPSGDKAVNLCQVIATERTVIVDQLAGAKKYGNSVACQHHVLQNGKTIEVFIYIKSMVRDNKCCYDMYILRSGEGDVPCDHPIFPAMVADNRGHDRSYIINNIRGLSGAGDVVPLGVERSISDKALFFSNVKRDIKDHMNAILGFADPKFVESIDGIMSDDIMEYMECIYKSAVDVYGIIESVIKIASLNLDGAKLDLAKSDMVRVMEAGIKSVSADALERRMTISRSYAGDQHLVYISESLFRDALSILMRYIINKSKRYSRINISISRNEVDTIVIIECSDIDCATQMSRNRSVYESICDAINNNAKDKYDLSLAIMILDLHGAEPIIERLDKSGCVFLFTLRNYIN